MLVHFGIREWLERSLGVSPVSPATRWIYAILPANVNHNEGDADACESVGVRAGGGEVGLSASSGTRLRRNEL
jgi:hypothetical protein